MRVRVWVLLGAIALAIITGFIGRGTGLVAFDTLAGLAWLTAIVIAITLLPFWSRILPEVPPMAGMFTAPVDGQRWCTYCGTPAPSLEACTVCGVAPKPPKQKAPKAPKKKAERAKKQ